MTNHAEENGKGWLANISEMMTDLRLAESGGDEDATEACRQKIWESPLSLEVRNNAWRSLGDKEGSKPDQFRILLTTGGPALQLVGDLGEWAQPENPRLQWQDWGTPWTDLRTTEEEEADLLAFACQFYFEEE